ncbi:hypothetical protein [Acinetobacter baumannii]|uniref:hypothetical protein n=1 Tax=Acinetobacter baumannii TaxID=470 RepID=UPI002340E651|nr:hypothetical protein [Acinetobacter baumannii]MDC4147560.1 hypothetical protein [Acinetobacter baumannii]
MLIDEIDKQLYVDAENHDSTAKIAVSNSGMLSIIIHLFYKEKKFHVALIDELINFIPQFYFPLDNDTWECIILVDHAVFDPSLFPYKLTINPVLKQGKFILKFQDDTITFDLSKLKFTREILGDAIYASIEKQAKYIELL